MAVLIGEDAPIIEAALKSTLAEHHVVLVHAKTLEEALQMSRDACHSGDAVLLSPACASFDMFLNYEDRGTQFEQLVLLK
jgi:UDP-N-acetylmuramoylalanine--D-glutamate ligase